MRTDTLLNVPSDFLEQLGSEVYYTGGTIPDLGVLGACNVYQCSCSRVDDVKQFQDRGTIIRDLSLAALVYDQLVHSTRPKCARKRLCDGQACRDIGQELCLALRGVRALLEEDDGRLLQVSEYDGSQGISTEVRTIGRPRCMV